MRGEHRIWVGYLASHCARTIYKVCCKPLNHAGIFVGIGKQAEEDGEDKKKIEADIRRIVRTSYNWCGTNRIPLGLRGRFPTAGTHRIYSRLKPVVNTCKMIGVTTRKCGMTCFGGNIFKTDWTIRHIERKDGCCGVRSMSSIFQSLLKHNDGQLAEAPSFVSLQADI
jgi:hypothetical protein